MAFKLKPRTTPTRSPMTEVSRTAQEATKCNSVPASQRHLAAVPGTRPREEGQKRKMDKFIALRGVIL